MREQSSAEGGRVGGRPPLDLALPPRRRSPRAQSGRQGGPRTSKGGCDGHHREGATHRQAENSRSWAGRIESGALSRSEIHRLSLRRGLGILRRLGHVDGLDLGHGDCTLRPAEVDGGRARSRAGGSCGAWQVDGLRGSHWVNPPPVG